MVQCHRQSTIDTVISSTGYFVRAVTCVLLLFPSISRDYLFFLSIYSHIYILIFSRCTMLAGLVMYAHHVFDPCALCTLHNYLLLCPEEPHLISSVFLMLRWQQSRPSLPSSFKPNFESWCSLSPLPHCLFSCSFSGSTLLP